MKENIASFLCSTNENETENETDQSSKIRGKIIDFPGYPSLRTFPFLFFIMISQLEKHYPHCAGIVFLIDGTHYNVKDIAEYSLNLISNKVHV